MDVREFPNMLEVDGELCSKTAQVIEFNSMVWKQKKDLGLSLNSPISDVKVPEEIVEFTDVLTAMHKLE